MKANIKSVNSSIKVKDKPTVPKGAEIVSHECTVNVEEIENGYLITKSGDIRYKLKGSQHTEYTYYTKKYFTEENPIKVEEKSLADVFKDDNYE